MLLRVPVRVHECGRVIGGDDLAVTGCEVPALQVRVQVRSELAEQFRDETNRPGEPDAVPDLVEVEAELLVVVGQGIPVLVEEPEMPRYSPADDPISFSNSAKNRWISSMPSTAPRRRTFSRVA